VREAFRIAHDVSSYSLTALAQRAQPLMAGRHGALLTLSYLGAVRSVPSYNVMGMAKASLEASVRYLALGLGPKGIRVNGISAGPVKTLAAAGISGFGRILKFVEENAPLRRNSYGRPPAEAAPASHTCKKCSGTGVSHSRLAKAPCSSSAACLISLGGTSTHPSATNASSSGKSPKNHSKGSARPRKYCHASSKLAKKPPTA
jgi:hypothetical protein